MNKKTAFIFVLILILASIIRFYNPTFRSLWGDEVDSIFKTYDFAANQYSYSKPAFFDAISFPIRECFQDGRQIPVYFIALSLWDRMFGISEFSIRCFSIFLGMISIVVIFFISNKWFGKKTALLSAFLLSISPFHLMYSHEVRAYALLSILGPLSIYSFFELLKQLKAKNVFFYLLYAVLMLYSHYYGFLVYAVQILYLFLKKRVISVFALQFIIFTLYLPALINILRSNILIVFKGDAVLPYANYNFAFRVASFLFAFMFGETIAPWNPIIVVGIIVYFIILFYQRKILWKNEIEQYIIFFVFIPILMAGFFLKNSLPNYLMTVYPLFVIFVAYNIMRLKLARQKILLICGLIFVYSAGIINYYNLSEYHNSNRLEPWNKISEYINHNKIAGDTVITSDYYCDFRLAQYYLNILAKNNMPIMIWNDKKLELPSAKRFWLITSIHNEANREKIKNIFDRQLRLVDRDNFIPYASTVAARLPIKHHKDYQGRIDVSLYYNN